MKQALIRVANDKDAEAIGRIHIQSWQKAYELYIPEAILNSLSLAERVQLWQNLLERGVHVLVLEINNEVIGFASIGSFRGEHGSAFSGEISAIYLNPKYWRKGYGAQLCLAAIEHLEKQGYNEVLLWVLSDNIQARNFYEHLGFVLTDETKLEEFYEGGALLKEVLYRKNLSI